MYNQKIFVALALALSHTALGLFRSSPPISKGATMFFLGLFAILTGIFLGVDLLMLSARYTAGHPVLVLIVFAIDIVYMASRIRGFKPRRH